LRNNELKTLFAGKKMHGVLVAERFDEEAAVLVRSCQELSLVRYGQDPDGTLVIRCVAGNDVLRKYAMNST
jgi:hypothetical protein